MNEDIQHRGDEVAIIIYDAPLPPKYFRLKKSFLKVLFVTIPLLIAFLLISFLIWGLASRLEDAPAPTLPVVMTESESKIYMLGEQVKTLQESNKALTDKLSSTPSVGTAEDPYLFVIKKPYGMQNLLKENKVILEQFDLKQTPNKIALNFHIVSNTSERRVSGHVIVFMLSSQGLLAYPKKANELVDQGIKYSVGETFSVSRLRPTTAEFTSVPGDSVRFIIYIFNREGDLILIKETEQFKLEAKS